MIRYVVRHRVGLNNQRRISFYEDRITALKEAASLFGKQRYPQIYVTRTEYASQQKLERDFSVQESIVWSEWFHGKGMLLMMIDKNDSDIADIRKIKKTGKLIAFIPGCQYWVYNDIVYSVNSDGQSFSVWCSVGDLDRHLRKIHEITESKYFTDNPDCMIVNKEFLSEYPFA